MVLAGFTDQAARPIELFEAAAAAERAMPVLDRLGQPAAAALVAAVVVALGAHADASPAASFDAMYLLSSSSIS